MKNNKTITLRITFFTNDLPIRIGVGGGKIPIWNCGQVAIDANKEKGIKSGGTMFNGLDDIERAIRLVMKKHKIVILGYLGKIDDGYRRNK
jgi:hypothetical protein